MLREATLNIFGSYQYTPQLPAFFTGGEGAGQQSPDPFIRGVQAFRANTTTYSAGQTFGYRFTPTVSLLSNYRYTNIHFGNSAVTAAGTTLLDTVSHQMTLTPTVQVSAVDTLSETYALSMTEQSGVGSFRTHANTFGWKRVWSTTVSTQVNGGATYVEPSNTLIRNETIQNPARIVPSGGIVLTYNSRTELFSDLAETGGQLSSLKQFAGSFFPGEIGSTGDNSLRLRYNYGVYPLLVQNGGLAKSHLLGLDGIFSFSSVLTGTYGINYARNTATSGQTINSFSFETISGNAGLRYLVTPSLQAAVNYSYSNSYGIGPQESTTTNSLTYARQMVMLTLTYAFGGGSHVFQGGGYSGSSGGAGIGPSSGGSGGR
jgi:hypothetical protein